MNKCLSLTWHLVRKDIRHQWLSLIGLWVLALLIPVCLLFSDYNGIRDENWILISLFFILDWFVLIRLIHLDPPARVVQFLGTRAVPWLPLVSSKIIFAFLFLMSPVWVARLLSVLTAGIIYTPGDVALFLIESGATVGACIGAVALPAMFCRRISTVIFALIISLVVVTFSISFLRVNETLTNPGIIVNSAMWLLSIAATVLSYFCLTILGNLTFALTVLGTALLRYRYRSLSMSAAPAFIGITCALILSALVTTHQFNLISQQDREFLANLKPTFPEKTLFSTVMGSECSIEASLSLSGFKAPYYGANLSLLNARATLGSGRVFEVVGDTHRQDIIYGQPIPPLNLKRHLVAVPSQIGIPLYPQQVPLFRFQTGDLHSGEELASKLSGLVSMEVYRAELLPMQLRIESGATLSCQRRHYAIKDLNVTESTVEFRLEGFSAPLSLLGDNESVVELVYNPATGESLTPVGGNEYLPEGVFIKQSSDIRRYAFTRILPPGVAKPDMRIWVKGARVAFFAIHDLGEQTFPFEMTNVSLLLPHRSLR